MADHDFWARMSAHLQVNSDARDGAWKTATDAELVAKLDLSALDAAETIEIKALYHKWVREPYGGICTVADVDDLKVLWDQCEP